MQGNENIAVRTLGHFTSVTLNRPAKLNALSRDMIDVLWATYMRLLDQETANNLHVALLKGAGGKALCAGGDVKQLVLDAESGNWKAGVEFFRAETGLDYLISRLADGNIRNGRPVIAQVAIMDGIVMGGGAGLAMNGQFRVATEKSIFSMPETAIGFFPDIGASSFLSRSPCGLGELLALSGRRLRGRELLWAGLATHYIPSRHIPAVEEALMGAFDGTQMAPPSTKQRAIDSLHTVDSILTSFQEPAAVAAGGVLHWLPPGEAVGDMFHPSSTGMAAHAPENLPEDVLKQYQAFSALLGVADKHFSRCESAAALLRTLEAAARQQDTASSANVHGWSFEGARNARRAGGVGAAASSQEIEKSTCAAVLEDLRSMSPMSLRLTLKLYREAAQMSVGQVLQRDFTVCANCTRYGWDFWRGVRSKLVEKQKRAPWMHKTVEDVPNALLDAACREPDFCDPLDLGVVDRLFEQTAGRTAGSSAQQARDTHIHVPATVLQARL